MYCFSLFCRLCFRRDCKLMNLYTKDEDNVTFCEKLKSCIPEIINEEDRVPNFICDNCCTKLKKGYEFKIMCIKNHIALREYAKHLLKYMENPQINQDILNMKLAQSEPPENDSVTSDKNPEVSDSESICSEKVSNNPIQPEFIPAEVPSIIDEPLALVKVPKNPPSPKNIPQISSKLSSDNLFSNTDVKSDSYSDDSSDYQCEDLSKKPRLVIDEDRDSKSPNPSNKNPKFNLIVPKDFSNIANIQNDSAMKFLKLEYSDKDENSRNENTSSVDQPKNLSIADSETDQETDHKWNHSTPEEPSKKMKTRTKDKYRIVYTENQRLELEKEFIVSRYITTSRKMQLSTSLNLSQRQIKIWFQNRRAKERKQVKRSVEQLGVDNSTENLSETTNTKSELQNSSVITSVSKNEDILPQIMEIQNALFLLKQQKELRDNLQQNKDPRDGFDELYKIKEDLLNKRLQVLVQKQNEISNSVSNELDDASNASDN